VRANGEIEAGDTVRLHETDFSAGVVVWVSEQPSDERVGKVPHLSHALVLGVIEAGRNTGFKEDVTSFEVLTLTSPALRGRIGMPSVYTVVIPCP